MSTIERIGATMSPFAPGVRGRLKVTNLSSRNLLMRKRIGAVCFSSNPGKPVGVNPENDQGLLSTLGRKMAIPGTACLACFCPTLTCHRYSAGTTSEEVVKVPARGGSYRGMRRSSGRCRRPRSALPHRCRQSPFQDRQHMKVSMATKCQTRNHAHLEGIFRVLHQKLRNK